MSKEDVLVVELKEKKTGRMWVLGVTVVGA
jgi:hypothetical protein